jgi:hypothetical protein
MLSLRATLRKLMELCLWVEEIDFVSDAGSGY